MVRSERVLITKATIQQYSNSIYLALCLSLLFICAFFVITFIVSIVWFSAFAPCRMFAPLVQGDFYKLSFRKFRENIWKILGRKEGAMRALRPNDRQVDSNIILNLRKSSLSLLFVLKSFERGIYRKPLKGISINCLSREDIWKILGRKEGAMRAL